MEVNTQTVTILDKTAIGLSMLCLVHCLLLPLIVPFLPLLIPFEETPFLHEALAIILFALAAFAFVRGYKVHGKKIILYSGLLGVLGLGLALLLPGNDHGHSFADGAVSPQGILTSIGGVVLITAHLFNIRACKCRIADSSCGCQSSGS